MKLFAFRGVRFVILEISESKSCRCLSTAMSMELDSPQLSKIKKHRKIKEQDVERSEKKRKRKASDDLELASPTKKHRSKQHSESTEKHELSSIKPEVSITSPFFKQTSSLYLPLPPISQKHPLKGLCAEHLSPLILTYYPPFHGVIISYSNIRLSTDPISKTKPAYAKSIDEYAANFVWLTADFMLLRPQKDDLMEGWVNLQNESNIGLLCLNFFNITIERRRLAKTWKWKPGGVKASGKRKLKKAQRSSSSNSDEEMEDSEGEQEAREYGVDDTQGYFQDSQGQKVEGLVRFRVKGVETSRSMDRETSFLNIEGTMLSVEEEKELQEQETFRVKEKDKRLPRHVMSGALTNGHDGPMDIDQPMELTSSLKHRAKY